MIQVYTGCGKGKTTAALGLAVRAAGAGKCVYICQFAKGRSYSEHKSLTKLNKIKLRRFGRSCFIKRSPEKIDVDLACAGLKKAKLAVLSNKYKVVILDEINVALKYKLIPLKALLELIKSTPKKTELILTGRYAHPQIIKLADLVSEIKEIKHYYRKGVKARKGIEY